MSVITELHEIYEKNGEVLRAEDIVEYARNPKTELHKHFVWDDSEAAKEYRLIQARNVIRVNVVMVEPTQQTVRAFVSLVEDRNVPGGGYRRIEHVMADPVRRTQLLNQALREAQAWRDKYKSLQELAPIFKAMDKVTTLPVTQNAPEKVLELVA